MDMPEAAHKADSKNAGRDLAKLAAAGAAALTTITGVLALLGYGVSLALETMFGIPHATIFESSFELLDLASIAVMQSLPAIIEALGKWATYEDIYKRALPILSVFFVAWLIFAGLLWWKNSRKDTKSKADKAKPEKKLAVIYRYLPVFLLILLSPLVSIAGVVLVAAFLIILSIVPIIGLVAANSYLNDTVIQPKHCNPLIGLEERRKPAVKKAEKGGYGAQCIVITKDGKPVASGRIVFATSKAIILYSPNGGVTRASLGDSIIEVVADLPTH